MQIVRFLRDLARSFLRHGCASLAASLAFFSLLSLFPLVFLLLYGLSFVVNQDVIGAQVILNALKGFLPSMGEHVVTELQRVSALETVRWAVFLTFVWFGTLVFYELDYALNVVFESTWKRHPLISTAIAVASLGVTGLVLILSYVATQAINFLTAYAPRLWGLDLLALAAHDLSLTYTLPFSLAFLVVTGLYRLVPRRRPQWREAMIGALTFSLLWVAAKLLFAIYGTYATVYGDLYGSLLEVILTLLWFYYSAALLLIGAEVAHCLQQQEQVLSATAMRAAQSDPALPKSPQA
ncbi:MAG TPA: YihY/virulence factor BrkB family protein [Nitrospiraceae bacterium]|nr:YihY/virulence factor BrkB family protein [Nitrospiraceae bacterium]